ncbi:group I truncated hemoglobin [Echinimonas agarilytica]|uniref:Group 1 truncated hemoglobin n=1 Tax=Echinimonas agarilytica TaxID=1215918 RepID=A0AA41W7E3_9GAMM|nr:group 1 truncated hemoglobin [Echinimonas agarilytica]MCM2680086.1 group 1 truncated hemoglobin [Echinimonas agarilytica]
MFGLFKKKEPQAATVEEKAMTVFDKLGGAAAIDAAVDIFYRKVLADDRISHFFDTIDMQAQHVKQKAFLTMAFGGPNNYSGKDMREAHKHMNLTEEHFTAVAESLVGTLQELGVGQEDIDSVVTIAVSVKDDVLNK